MIAPVSFHFIANTLALDLVNTQTNHADLLCAPSDLQCWLRQAGYGEGLLVDDKTLAAAKVLREAIRVLFEATLSGARVSKTEIECMNSFLSAGKTVALLQDTAQGLVYEPFARNRYATQIFAQIASEGAQLLTSDKVARVRACAHENCILMFLDVSKSGRRRWCSMDSCGNRFKVARHYQRVGG